MVLEITQKNGTYFLNGKINASSKLYFMTYFEEILIKEDKVKINIGDIEEIDKQGLKALFYMMKTALDFNKEFSIVGYGCKDVYDHFNQKVA